jgi:hypothetical protein
VEVGNEGEISEAQAAELMSESMSGGSSNQVRVTDEDDAEYDEDVPEESLNQGEIDLSVLAAASHRADSEAESVKETPKMNPLHLAEALRGGHRMPDEHGVELRDTVERIPFHTTNGMQYAIELGTGSPEQSKILVTLDTVTPTPTVL